MEGAVFIGYYFWRRLSMLLVVGETLDTLVSGFVRTFNPEGK